MVRTIYPDIAGKAVLVSGGGSGIGAAVAEAFLAQGAHVAVLDRNAAALDALRSRLSDADGRLHVRAVDLVDIDAVRAAVVAFEAVLGGFRVLVNNAGDDSRHKLAEVTPALWDDRFDVNIRHQFFLAQAVAPGMAAAGGGAIVNLGSIAWMFGAVDMIAYASAKSAVQGLTKSLARELGADRITVNAIAPGWVLTEKQMARPDATPEKYAAYLERQAIKEHLEPRDVAALALWLASDDARRCSGQTFILDGGLL